MAENRTKTKLISRAASLCKVSVESVYALYDTESDFREPVLIGEFDTEAAANKAESQNECSYVQEQRYLCFRNPEGGLVGRLSLNYVAPNLKITDQSLLSKLQALSKLSSEDLDALGIDLDTWNPW